MKNGINYFDVYSEENGEYSENRNDALNKLMFEKWDKSKYVKLSKDNSTKFLLKSHGDFFKSEEGVLMRLREEIREIIFEEDFVRHI